MIFSTIFFDVWLAQKNYKMQKSEFDKCRRNPVAVARLRLKTFRSQPFWPDLARSMAGSSHIQPDPSRFGQIRQESTGFRPFWADPACLVGIRQYSGRNLVAECCRTPAPVGFRRSDIKRACKNEEFNFKK
jgi:hypothetical protein